MTERDSLYAAVLAEPEADAPRLVYADWLDEHPRGDADAARAAFIRLEVEAEALPADSPQRAAMEEAAAKLFNRHGDQWNGEHATWGECSDSTLVYRRGFPEELRTDVQTLLANGGRLLREAPIRSLCVTTWYERPPWFDEWPRPTDPPDLSGLRSLTVGPRLPLAGDSEGVRGVFHLTATYPTLTNLERLSFAGNGMDDDAAFTLAEALADAVFADTLVELDLSDNLIRAVGAITLSVAPPLPRLRRLVLTGNPLTDYGRRMLQNTFGDRAVF